VSATKIGALAATESSTHERQESIFTLRRGEGGGGVDTNLRYQ
jgi:hypothetical protein